MSRSRNDGPHGILLIDKPSGITSHDVVNRVRKLFGTKRVGHTGTLDPMATGLLVICLGHATRIAEYLASDIKTYDAEITFGIETDSEDITGTVLSTTDASNINVQDICTVLPQFTGNIFQIPPMVSALHHEGKRLYELARDGITVDREARPVTVHALELDSFHSETPPKALITVTCSTGFYVRTLAANIGTAVKVGGCLSMLRRTRCGAFTIDNAVTLDDLSASESDLRASRISPIASSLPDWRRAELTTEQADDIMLGRKVIFNMSGCSDILLLNPENEAIGIGRLEENIIQPVKVFAGSHIAGGATT